MSTYVRLTRHESRQTTLSETVVADILDVWILDSAVENRSRPQIRLLPKIVYQIKKIPWKPHVVSKGKVKVTEDLRTGLSL